MTPKKTGESVTSNVRLAGVTSADRPGTKEGLNALSHVPTNPVTCTADLCVFKVFSGVTETRVVGRVLTYQKEDIVPLVAETSPDAPPNHTRPNKP